MDRGMKCPSCGSDNIAGSDECQSCQASLINVEAPKKGMERRILEGTVAHLTPKPALSVPPGESLKLAIEEMRKHKVGCVLVLDGGQLLGVLSEREILLRMPEGADPSAVSVKQLMRTGSTALREDDEVADAFHQMAVSGHRHLPVRLKNGSFGVISARDLLRYLCQ